MQIDRPRADDAAAGQGNPRLAQPRQQRPGDADGAAHFADEIVVGIAFDFMGVNRHRAVLKFRRRAERFQNFHHEPRVGQVGHTADDARFVREQRRRQDGQRGILAAADGDFAVQRHAAFDDQAFHDFIFFLILILVLILDLRG